MCGQVATDQREELDAQRITYGGAARPCRERNTGRGCRNSVDEIPSRHLPGTLVRNLARSASLALQSNSRASVPGGALIVPKLVGVRRGVHFRIFPRENHRKPLAAIQKPVALHQMRSSGSRSAARYRQDAFVGKADSIHHQRVALPMPDRIAGGRGIEGVRADVRPSVGIDVARGGPHRRGNGNLLAIGILHDLDRGPRHHRARRKSGTSESPPHHA